MSDVGCINDCRKGDKCCICSGQCQLLKAEQENMKNQEAVIGCEGTECKVKVVINHLI